VTNAISASNGETTNIITITPTTVRTATELADRLLQ